MSDLPIERLTSLVTNVLSGTPYDCLTIDLRSREFDFTIEFASFSHGDYYNVTNLPVQNDTWLRRRIGLVDYNPEVRHRLTANTALTVDDVGAEYVQFAVEDTTPPTVADNIAALAEATAGRASVDVEDVELRALNTRAGALSSRTKEVSV